MAFDVGRRAPNPNPARVGLLFPDHPPSVVRHTAYDAGRPGRREEAWAR